MNADDIRRSCDTAWPIEARFVAEQAATELETMVSKLSIQTSSLEAFFRLPWWSRFFHRGDLKIILEGTRAILTEYQSHEEVQEAQQDEGDQEDRQRETTPAGV